MMSCEGHDSPGAEEIGVSGRVPVKAHVYIEFLFAIATLVALGNAIVFFYTQGHLPPPFFDDAGATFTDWYDTVYWGYKPGTYEEWLAIYPPFSFLFMDLFSTPSCYYESSLNGRQCDPLGVWALTGFAILNLILVYLDYRKSDPRTALPRAVALGFGAPVLFGWERGNVIVCCFTFFILAHGRLLRSTWLRWICFAFMANLKPYMILMVLGRLLRRKWRWVEGCGIACVLVYAVSYMILGKGNPLELISNIASFSGKPDSVSIYALDYATTYNSMLFILKTQLPLIYYLGSKIIETMELIAPWLIKLGDLGALLCFIGAIFYPTKLSSYRIAAITMVLLLTNSKSEGGYAEVFLLFFVFFEKWRGIGLIVALVAAYGLCVPWDMVLVNIIHVDVDSWLSGRRVAYDFGLTLGALARPGLLLVIQYGLVAASLMDLIGSRWRETRSPAEPSSRLLDRGRGVATL